MSNEVYSIPLRYRKMENLHILFWLLKDISWCLAWKPLGIAMIFPTLIMAVVIAVSMKIVGVLLITSLMIIPPATARNLATSPEQMAVGASLAGCMAVGCGVAASWFWDTPPGPSIVVVSASLFMLSSLVKRGG